MDFLSICHFVLYFIFAYFIKDNFLLITIIGIVWEIFEYTITNVPVTRDFLIKHWPIPIKYWNEKVKLKMEKTETGLIIPWMTENLPLRIEDLIFNSFGYFCGMYVYSLK